MNASTTWTIGVSLRACIIPEVLDIIIDHSQDDQKTLLVLSLVSHQALRRSRHLLFSTVEIDETYKPSSLNQFLSVVDAPWTSFTFAVESLHLKEIDRPEMSVNAQNRDDAYKLNLYRIASNLPNLKTLLLTSKLWKSMSPPLRQLLFAHLKITHLKLYWVAFPNIERLDIVELFSIIQPCVKTITALNIRYGRVALRGASATFQRPYHFTALDCSLLLLLQDVWDPMNATNLDVKVNTFHVRLCQLSVDKLPLLSRFMNHIGPSLEHIFINLTSYLNLGNWHLTNHLNLSNCYRLRSVYIGPVSLFDSASASVSTMWKLLASITSRYVEEISISVGCSVHDMCKIDHVGILAQFDGRAFVARLKHIVPEVKKIKLTMEGPFNRRQPLDFDPYIEVLRRGGLKVYEEEALVSFDKVPAANPNSRFPFFADSPLPQC